MGIKILIINLIIFLLFCGYGKYQEENIKKIINHNETESFSEACSEEDTQDNTQVDLKNNTQDDVKSNTDKMPTDYYTKEEGQIWLNKLIDMGYSVSSEKFMDINNNKNIIINYPKITGFKDKKLETKINQAIKNSSVEKYHKLFDDNSFKDNEYVEWPVNYTIVFFNNDLISIVFEGFIKEKHKDINEDTYFINYGINIIYTTNINIKTGERISTDSLFTEEFKNKFDYKYLKGVDIDTTNADENAVNETFEHWKEFFYPSYNNFYFYKNGLIIISPWNPFPRYIIYYEDLKDCIKPENPIWESFLE